MWKEIQVIMRDYDVIDYLRRVDLYSTGDWISALAEQLGGQSRKSVMRKLKRLESVGALRREDGRFVPNWDSLPLRVATLIYDLEKRRLCNIEGDIVGIILATGANKKLVVGTLIAKMERDDLKDIYFDILDHLISPVFFGGI